MCPQVLEAVGEKRLQEKRFNWGNSEHRWYADEPAKSSGYWTGNQGLPDPGEKEEAVGEKTPDKGK